MLENKILFQPHGVGIRHSVYEAMVLGVRSQVPESTYMSAELASMLLKDSQEIIEYFEKHMTPQKIVNNILEQSKNIMM